MWWYNVACTVNQPVYNPILKMHERRSFTAFLWCHHVSHKVKLFCRKDPHHIFIIVKIVNETPGLAWRYTPHIYVGVISLWSWFPIQKLFCWYFHLFYFVKTAFEHSIYVRGGQSQQNWMNRWCLIAQGRSRDILRQKGIQ